jgi:DNA-binding XRE family transcriptional regulator
MTQIEYRMENGRRYAMVPAEYYQRLAQMAEDAEDIAIIRRQQAEPQATIPAAVLERILDGGNPIRAWRQHRNIPLVDLARRVGLSRGYLHQLEAGRRNMSVATLRKLADALDTDMDFLMP